jgi:ornithine--oxo-acid transaminase
MTEHNFDPLASDLFASDLFAARESQRYELHTRFLNEQMVRMLRAIGYDVRFCRGQGQYLYDWHGHQYLDMLSGWGVFAIGRNHPVLRDALKNVLDSDLPNLVQFDVSTLAGILAERLLAQVPWLEKVFFANSGAETVEAAIKFARTATGRPGIVSCEHAFHGLTLGALSLNGDAVFRAGFGPLLPGCVQIPFNDLAALERALAARQVAAFVVEPIQGKGVNLLMTTILPAPPTCAKSTARCSLPMKSRPGSVAPGGFSRSSTGASSPTWSCSPNRFRAARCRSARC